MKTIALQCPRCGDDVTVEITYSGKHIRASFAGPEEFPYPQVSSLECAQRCALSLQEEYDLEVEALSRADVDASEDRRDFEEWKRGGWREDEE